MLRDLLFVNQLIMTKQNLSNFKLKQMHLLQLMFLEKGEFPLQFR